MCGIGIKYVAIKLQLNGSTLYKATLSAEDDTELRCPNSERNVG